MKRIRSFLLKEKKNIVVAFLITIILLILTYLGNNIERPLLENNDYIRRIEYKHSGLVNKLDSIRRIYYPKAVNPTDYLLINTAYDKVPINKFDGDSIKGRIIGEQYITDRKKLIDFLEVAKQSNYKHIIVDLDFSYELKNITNDSIDKKLVELLLSMNNVIIPAVVNNDGTRKRLIDDRLIPISYSAVNIGTWRISNLTPMPLIHKMNKKNDTIKSIPLYLYEEATGNTYKERVLFSTINNRLCHKKVFVYNYIKDKAIGKHTYKTYYSNLGVDYLNTEGKKSTIPLRIKDKNVIIGDFVNDKINTYAGSLPGSLVLLNEYYSLLEKWNMIGFELITIFILYFITILCIIRGKSFWSFVFRKLINKKPKLKAIIISLAGSIFSMTVLFNIIKVILVFCFHTYFCVYVPVIIIPLLSIILNPEYEKKTNYT